MQNRATSAEDAELDIFELSSRIWRQRWLVVVFSGAFAVAGAAYGLLANPVYRAEAIVIEMHDDGLGGAASLMNQLGGLASIVGVNLGGGTENRNGKAILESRRLSEEFIRRYVPIEKLIPESGPRQTLWRAVEYFRKNTMKIRDDARSGKITVSIDWRDAETAARFANDYIALANELVRSRTLDEAARDIKYLNEQLEKTDVIELRRVMFDLIQNETKRMMVANSRPEYAFAVVDPAVAPELRFSPQRTRIVILTAVAGAIVGVLVALGRDAITRYRRRRATV